MRTSKKRGLVSIFLLLQLMGSTPALAQQKTLAPLAERVSRDLDRAGLKSAVVFVFSGPGEQNTELGRQLADEFAAAISAGGKPIGIVDRASLAPHIQKHGLAKYVGQLGVACWLAEQAGAKAFIGGSIEVSGDAVQVNVRSFATKECRRVSTQSLQLSLNEERRALVATQLAPPQVTPPDPGDSSASAFPGIVRAGQGGTTFARCAKCPNPTYSEEARRAGLDCTVLLRAVVTKEGRAEQIQIARPCPLGLTEKAIAAVQQWRFKPATGPDGSPVNAWSPIEISFRTYQGRVLVQ